MRSKLFVPGTRPDLFSKALAGPADAISIDMEDSVIAAKKEEVRKTVNKFLLSPKAIANYKTIIVRCNSITSPLFEKELRAVIQPRLDILNLPKIESASDVLFAVELIEKAELANNVAVPIKLLINIETPKGLRNAAFISAAHQRVVGLQLGLNDLFDSCGIQRSDSASIHTIMLMVRMAASEAGIKVYDGAFTDIEDKQGFHDETAMAVRLGFSGKSCIHPKQVETVNQMFMHAPEDLAFAQKIVCAAKDAENDGIGVFVLAGKMIDQPSIQRAKTILAEHERISSGQNLL